MKLRSLIGQCVQSLETTRKYNHHVNGQTMSSIIQVNTIFCHTRRRHQALHCKAVQRHSTCLHSPWPELVLSWFNRCAGISFSLSTGNSLGGKAAGNHGATNNSPLGWQGLGKAGGNFQGSRLLRKYKK